jgi:hypothetical protein
MMKLNQSFLEYENMDDVTQFVNAAAVTFGIKELKKPWNVVRIHAEMQFLNGTQVLFMMP